MANFTANYPGAGGGGGSGSNASVGTNTSPAPASSTEVGFVDGSGNLQPFSGASAASGPNVVVSGSALPTGGATSANQVTQEATLTAIQANQTNGTQHTIVDSSALPSGASTSALQTTGNTSLSSILADMTNGTQVTQVTGTIPLPTGSATAALQSSVQGTVAPGTAATNSNLSGMVYNSTVTTPANGQQMALTSDLFENLNTVQPDVYVTGAAAQTATVNNILTPSSGSSATDLINYKSAIVQIISTGTGGTFLFEVSNDNVNFVSTVVYNSATITGTPVTGSTTASASQTIYTLPIYARYLRLRIVTTITGGSIQAISKYSQAPWSPSSVTVAQSVAANLNANVGSVLNSFSGVTSSTTDIASAAITTTTTTAALTPQSGSGYTVNIAVTATSGTGQTMSVAIQESPDAGTNWFTVYTFPLITATGSYNSAPLYLSGNRIRYVQTIAGSSPSFTRSLTRLMSSTQIPEMYRNLIDTTIAPITTNSTTPSVFVEGLNTYTAIVNQGTGGSSVIFAMDGSDDNVNWISAIALVNGVVGGATPVPMTYSGIAYRFVRVRVVSGVASTTISSVSIVGSVGSGGINARGPLADRSGSTSATPSTSTTLASANTQRKYLLIQNLSAATPIYINFTSAASATVGSFYIAPLGSYVSESSFIPTEQVNVLATVASIPFVAKEG